jgi:hypothetical protein
MHGAHGPRLAGFAAVRNGAQGHLGSPHLGEVMYQGPVLVHHVCMTDLQWIMRVGIPALAMLAVILFVGATVVSALR